MGAFYLQVQLDTQFNVCERLQEGVLREIAKVADVAILHLRKPMLLRGEGSQRSIAKTAEADILAINCKMDTFACFNMSSDRDVPDARYSDFLLRSSSALH